MKLLQRFILANRKFYLGTGLFLLVLLGGAVTQVSAADCDNNSIINCGYTTPTNFIQKVNANTSGNGHNDLKAIYANYGLVPSEYNRFVTSAQPGVAYKSYNGVPNVLVVGGKIVATNVKSIGRIAANQGSGYFSTAIPNAGTFYGNTNDKAFASSSLPVNVLFNSRGQVEFAVINSCGNPVYGTNVAPTYSCNTLNESPVAGQDRTYHFSASATAGNNATIVKLVYNFGDGITATTTNPATVVSHTYAKDATYTAQVTVYVSLPGNQTVTVTAANCKKVITVSTPYYSCIQLGGAILDASKYRYSFTASAKFGNGAKLVSANFNFGDNQKATGVLPSGSTVSATHQYAKPGTYQAGVTLYFAINGNTAQLKNVSCTAKVTPTQPPTPECKPGVPEGSPMCTPCRYNSNIPSTDSRCIPPVVPPTTPPVLPNTGAGDVIAVFAAAVVAGFLIFRFVIVKRHATNGGVMTSEGMFVGPVVSPDTGVVISHHHEKKHNPNAHRNAVHPLRHPTYHQPHRFRPTKKHGHETHESDDHES